MVMALVLLYVKWHGVACYAMVWFGLVLLLHIHVLRVQACMRPCTPDALPVMGRIPGVDGAFISCGHNCWGKWTESQGGIMRE